LSLKSNGIFIVKICVTCLNVVQQISVTSRVAKKNSHFYLGFAHYFEKTATLIFMKNIF